MASSGSAPSRPHDVVAEELAALDLAVETLKRSGLIVEADDLLVLCEKILALVPRSKAARLETDHEVLLEAQGLAARPGPRQRIDRTISATIAEAIKSSRIVQIAYQSRGEDTPSTRQIAPYGLLTGIRRYLVAKPADDLDGRARLYVVENIREVQITPQGFVRDPSFNLQVFANQSFGVFQHPEEFGEVVWRFDPKAAVHASFGGGVSARRFDAPKGLRMSPMCMRRHLGMRGDSDGGTIGRVRRAYFVQKRSINPIALDLKLARNTCARS